MTVAANPVKAGGVALGISYRHFAPNGHIHPVAALRWVVAKLPARALLAPGRVVGKAFAASVDDAFAAAGMVFAVHFEA